jgi:alpha-tubulin suppressor-like RCC1 family protein
VINFTSTASTVSEGGLISISVQLTDSFGNPYITPLPVVASLVYSGSARRPDQGPPATNFDIASVPATVTIPVGSSSAIFTFLTFDDSFSETMETVDVTIASVSNALAGENINHIARITDNEPNISVSFQSSSSLNQTDGAGSLPITILVSGTFNQSIRVPISFSGSASLGSDFTSSTGIDNFITISAGTTSTSITLSFVGDLIYEGTESVIVTLGQPFVVGVGDIGVIGTNATHSFNILEDQSSPVVNFTSATFSTFEPDNTQNNSSNNSNNQGRFVNIQVAANKVSAVPVVVNYVINPASTANTSDHNLIPGEIVIPAGQLTATKTFQVLHDDLDEVDETIIINLDTSLAATIATPITLPPTPVATIGQNVTLPPVGGTLLPVPSILAGVTNGQRVILTGQTNAAQNGIYLLTFNATHYFLTAVSSGQSLPEPAALAGLDNYDRIELTGQASASENGQYIFYRTTTHYFLTRVTNPIIATVGVANTHTVTILDNDNAPNVSFYTESQSVNEAAGDFKLQVKLDKVSGKDVDVMIKPTWIRLATPKYLHLEPKALTGSVPPTPSNPLEEIGTNLNAGDYIGLLAQSVPAENGLYQYTESLGTYTLVPAYSTVNIPLSGAHPLILGTNSLNHLDRIELKGQTTATQNGKYIYQVSGGNYTLTKISSPLATLNDDFTTPGAWPPYMITIPAGSLSVQETFPLVSDSAVENSENIFFEISYAPKVTLSANQALIGALPHAMGSLVNYDIVSLTAQTTTSENGLYYYSDDTVNYTLTPIRNNAVLGSPFQHTLSIVDDEFMPTVNFASSTSVANESTAIHQIQLTLSSASSNVLTVPIKSITGAAKFGAGKDYLLPTGWAENDPLTWKVTFAPNTTTATIDFTIIDDKFYEQDEKILIELDHGPNVAINTASGIYKHTVNLVSNEVAPTVSFGIASQTYNFVNSPNITSTPVASVQETAGFFDIVARLEHPDPLFEGTDEEMIVPISYSSVILPLYPASISQDFFVPNGFNPAAADSTWMVKIAKGEKAGYVRFPLVNDTAYENLEVARFTMPTIGSGTYIKYNGVDDISVAHTNPSQSFDVSIVSEDAEPLFSFALSSQVISEGSGTITVNVNLTGANEVADAVVNLGNLGGTAAVGASCTAGVDYVLNTPSPLVFSSALKETQKQVGIMICDDANSEGSENFQLQLTTNSGASPNTSLLTHTVTIVDNEQLPRVHFAQTVYSNTTLPVPTVGSTVEGNVVTITVTNMDTISQLPITIPIVSMAGTFNIANDIDWTNITDVATSNVWNRLDPSTWKITIPAGSATGSLNILLTDDTADEPVENFTLVMGTPINAILGTNTQTRVDIHDADSPPTVAFAVATQQVVENNQQVEIEISLSAASGFPVSVAYQAVAVAVPVTEQATPGLDFNFVNGSITIPAGQSSTKIYMTLYDDLNFEMTEKIAFQLSSPNNATLGVITSHQIDIIDNDSPPEVSFETNLTEVTEPLTGAVDKEIQVKMVASATTYQNIYVPITISGSTAIRFQTSDSSDPIDYELPSYPLPTPSWAPSTSATDNTWYFHIPAGSSSATHTFKIKSDAFFEIEETIVLIMGNPVASPPPAASSVTGLIGINPIHTIYIGDSGPKPVITFSQFSQITPENMVTPFMVQSSRPSKYDLIIPITNISGYGTHHATMTDDYTLPAGWNTSDPSTWFLKINKSDNACSVAGGDRSTQTLCTAAAGVWNPNLTATASFTIVNDNMPEYTEGFQLNLDQPYVVSPNDQYLQKGAINKHVMFIEGSTATTPDVYFLSRTHFVNESNGGVPVNIRLSHKTSFPVIVNYRVISTQCRRTTVPAGQQMYYQMPCAPGPLNLAGAGNAPMTDTTNVHPATANTDFIMYDGSITIPANEIMVQFPVIPIINDADFERDEAFTIEIMSVSNANAGINASNTTVGENYLTTVVILNDETPPFVDFDFAYDTDPDPNLADISYQTVDEATGDSPTVKVKVQLSGKSVDPITVYFGMMGTATGATGCGPTFTSGDFTYPNQQAPFVDVGYNCASNSWENDLNRSLVIPAGSTTGEFSFKIRDDHFFEPDETVIFYMTSALNGTMGGRSTHVVTIVDRDPVPDPFFTTPSLAVYEPKLCSKYVGSLDPIPTAAETYEGTTFNCNSVGAGTNRLIYRGIQALDLKVKILSVPQDELVATVSGLDGDAVVDGDFVLPDGWIPYPGYESTLNISINPNEGFPGGSTHNNCANLSNPNHADYLQTCCPNYGQPGAYCEKRVRFWIADDYVYEATDDFSVTLGAPYLFTSNFEQVVLPQGNSGSKTATVTILNDEFGAYTKTNFRIDAFTTNVGNADPNDGKPKVSFLEPIQFIKERVDGISSNTPDSSCTQDGGTRVDVVIKQDYFSAFNSEVYLTTGTFDSNFDSADVLRSTAKAMDDHDFTPVSVTIPSGQSQGYISFCVLDDSLTEADERITFNIQSPIHAQIDTATISHSSPTVPRTLPRASGLFSTFTQPVSRHYAVIEHSDPAQLSLGVDHTCALISERVKCWGGNSSGQLGIGSTTNQTSAPQAFVNLGTNPDGDHWAVNKVRAGNGVTCALLSNKQIKCWGDASNGKLGIGYNIANPRIGDSMSEMGNALPTLYFGPNVSVLDFDYKFDHGCALLDDYTVKCWGRNNYGQLGTGDTQATGLNSFDLLAAPTVPFVYDQNDPYDFSAGSVTDNNIPLTGPLPFLYAFGIQDGDLIRLTNQTTLNNNRIFRYIEKDGNYTLSSSDLVQEVFVGKDHSCAIGFQGQTRCWGRGNEGAIGEQKCSMSLSDSILAPNPAQADGSTAPGAYDFKVSHFYHNGAGSGPNCANLGDNPEEIEKYSYDLSNLFEQAGIGPVDTMYLGYRNTCSFNSGLSMCWGNNTFGQLSKVTSAGGAWGMSSAQTSFFDAPFNTMSNRSIWDLYLNLSSDGIPGGQVGVSPNDTYAFVLFTDPSSPSVDLMPKKLALGNDFTCALLNNGQVKCIGRNNTGVHGRNDTTNTLFNNPIRQFYSFIAPFGQSAILSGSSSFTDVAAGQDHVCAVVKSHEIFCWGSDGQGRLGNGDSVTTTIGISATAPMRMIDGRLIVFPSLDSQIPILRTWP